MLKTHGNFALQSKRIKGIWLVVVWLFGGFEVEKAACVRPCVRLSPGELHVCFLSKHFHSSHLHLKERSTMKLTRIQVEEN